MNSDEVRSMNEFQDWLREKTSAAPCLRYGSEYSEPIVADYVRRMTQDYADRLYDCDQEVFDQDQIDDLRFDVEEACLELYNREDVSALIDYMNNCRDYENYLIESLDLFHTRDRSVSWDQIMQATARDAFSNCFFFDLLEYNYEQLNCCLITNYYYNHRSDFQEDINRFLAFQDFCYDELLNEPLVDLTELDRPVEEVISEKFNVFLEEREEATLSL